MYILIYVIIGNCIQRSLNDLYLLHSIVFSLSYETSENLKNLSTILRFFWTINKKNLVRFFFSIWIRKFQLLDLRILTYSNAFVLFTANKIHFPLSFRLSLMSFFLNSNKTIQKQQKILPFSLFFRNFFLFVLSTIELLILSVVLKVWSILWVAFLQICMYYLF